MEIEFDRRFRFPVGATAFWDAVAPCVHGWATRSTSPCTSTRSGLERRGHDWILVTGAEQFARRALEASVS